MSDRIKAPLVRLVPDPAKIVEAVLYILDLAQECRFAVTQYDIVKSIFLADKRHLNRFGRPITFDNYFAMKHGPVPSLVYDLLKGNQAVAEKAGVKIEWDRKSVTGKPQSYFTPQRAPDMEILSPSETELLRDCFGMVKSLGFGQIRRLTHEYPAYLDAWEDDGGENSSYPMSLGMMFDVPDMVVAQELEFVSKLAA